MTERGKRLKAKLPGDDTGIEVKTSRCDICRNNCRVDAYIKDGRVIRAEPHKRIPDAHSMTGIDACSAISAPMPALSGRYVMTMKGL